MLQVVNSLENDIKGDELYVIRTINEDLPINKPRFIKLKLKSSSFITAPKVKKVLVDIIISKFFDMCPQIFHVESVCVQH